MGDRSWSTRWTISISILSSPRPVATPFSGESAAGASEGRRESACKIYVVSITGAAKVGMHTHLSQYGHARVCGS